jgi:hypothetical protein
VEWNLEIQHSLGTKAIVSANYVGNYGYDELYTNNYLNSFGFGSLPATVPDPRVGHVSYLTSGAVSNYNGLTLSIQSNSWHGLTGGFNYTYSHALDEVSNAGILPFSVITSIETQINPYNLRDNYASADYDARHQLSATYIYELPFKSTNRLLNTAIGGWQLSGTMFYRTGFPFSVIDGATLGNMAGNNLTAAGAPSLQNTILLQPEFSQRNFSNVANCVVTVCFGVAGTGSKAPYLFAAATDFTGTTVGRNAFRGPGFLGGDMSLRKNFHLTERVGFQVGLNAYNWFNHANYGMPYPDTNAPFFGQVVTTQTPQSRESVKKRAASESPSFLLSGRKQDEIGSPLTTFPHTALESIPLLICINSLHVALKSNCYRIKIEDCFSASIQWRQPVRRRKRCRSRKQLPRKLPRKPESRQQSPRPTISRSGHIIFTLSAAAHQGIPCKTGCRLSVN